MPTRPRRACQFPGCKGTSKGGLGGGLYCDAHAQKKKPAWHTTEGSAHSRGYGAVWRKLRRMVLNCDPICKICLSAPSTCVDHIVNKAEGGRDELHNLQGLCDICHGQKTAKEALQVRRISRG